MVNAHGRRNRSVITCSIAFVCMTLSSSEAQVLQEDFNGVSGTGGGVFALDGSGFFTTPNWDDGLVGEGAFAGATGIAVIGEASATGTPTGGVGNSGAGVIAVADVAFNSIGEDFESITGSGGGDFVSDPAGENTVDDWDAGVESESAFAHALGGAVLGAATAEGVPGMGVGGTAAGRIAVENVTLNGGDWTAGISFAAPLPTGKPVNISFEEVETTDAPNRPAGYFYWGNAWAEPADPGMGLVPRTGDRLMKFWGNWSGNWNTSVVGQQFESQEGDVWEADCWTKHITGDSLVGTGNFVLLQIEFLDDNGDRITVEEHTVIDGNSPLDVWIDVPAFQGTAPAGTVAVNCIVMFLQPNFEGGAAQVDDLSFFRVSGPPALDTSTLVMVADVQATPAAGQTIGDYLLRLEDADGDALAFFGIGDGSFQSIGDVLDAGLATLGDGPNADGVFDPDSSVYTVTLAFDDPAASWGTGGTLVLDNLTVSSGSAANSGWYAGLYWEDLVAPVGAELSRMMLKADVKGDVAAGAYLMRVEGYRNQVVDNIDESFAAATGTGGGLMLNAESTESTFFVDNWDDGLSGEGAYGGVFGGAEICETLVCPDAGFWVAAVADGGVDGGPAAQIRVDSIVFSVGGDGWYAGLRWPNQVLPTASDLSQISLTADIKGMPTTGGPYGDFELRIEDAQNDRLFFRGTADGTWQAIGGALDLASNGAALDGNGDGTFDLDSGSYTVTVSFIDEVDTWFWGGTLTADNIFLSSGDVKREIGRVTFNQNASGNFKQIGGMLVDGVTADRVELDEKFSSATGSGGGEFFNAAGGGYTPSFDSGIAGVEAFAGTWGGAVVNGGASADGCLDCGVGGTPAARLDMYGIAPDGTSNGWWAGLSVVDLHPVMFDPSAVTLTADIKAMVDAPGETMGSYVLRIEDPDLDFLGFEVTADGSFQSVGGPLSAATAGAAGGGDGIIDLNAEWYHVVAMFNGNGGNWNAGGTLILDNVRLDGPTVADAETYTVVVTFADEVATWGSGGTLTVDNLLLTAVGDADCDGDGDVDLMDFAGMQNCFEEAPVGDCACADLDSDSDIDLTDMEIFTAQLAGPL